ncbi:MAG: GAF domain-containing protein [Deltaproteobacteria bacterium]|nr:GAF domain-containing protein [Deltaproteobacteria bacterium]
MAQLILNRGQSDERVFPLHEGANTIGRTKNNDVFVLHKSLSRAHAKIVVGSDLTTIEDLGSKNGTFVDGVRVDRSTLQGGHEIKCGDLVFAFLFDERSSLPKPTGAPTMTYDVGRDPMRRSLAQMLGGLKGGGTVINLQATKPEDRAREKLEILLKVSQLLSSPGEIDEVLSRTLDLLCDILDVDRGVILMMGDEGLEPRVTKTRPGVPTRATHSRQIVSYVLDHGVAALFADTQRDERLAGGASIIAQSIMGSMCAPLKPRDEIVGVLYVDNLVRPHQFGDEDLEFLSAFANQAAIALDNAALSAKLADEAMVRNNMLRFFPASAIETIMKDGGTLGAIDTEATVLFSDICGYTALSSALTPRDIIALLNVYFPVMADIVFQNEGTLEKYIGDALLAVWGAPFAREDDAELAVGAAVQMQRAMSDINQRAALPQPLCIHVGINSGPVAAGNIGSQRYLQYATIGDATNVASRICGVAQNDEIIIDERTAERLTGQWQLEQLKPVAVKGKSKPLQLVRVQWR